MAAPTLAGRTDMIQSRGAKKLSRVIKAKEAFPKDQSTQSKTEPRLMIKLIPKVI